MPGGTERAHRREPPAAAPRGGGPALVRGYLVGATVAAVAVAAHGAGGGGYPSSATLSLLVLVAGGIGALTGLVPGAGERPGRAALFVALAGGQWAGHAVLAGVLGHRHESSSPPVLFDGQQLPAGAMAAAHTLAALACGVLIMVAEGLYVLVSQAFRGAVDRPGTPAAPRGSIPYLGALPHIHRLLRSGVLGSRAPPAWS
ncbi:hypothetical protein NDR87_23490 [Nocardia sp. CDC159]|uniref:Uncharacterized protein n=1 Tax=Nocardia pulmonis TaxID=2951408 RepID=A0A9X2EAR9_9NOCA|nr:MULTISPECIES: hypothetical protein [Nocardia]MCM6776914.1 hypothetical protein [Nocardia pulmonis]MCM6789338.1 hypothetical protein [Nocardia sp. CDC159]